MLRTKFLGQLQLDHENSNAKAKDPEAKCQRLEGQIPRESAETPKVMILAQDSETPL